MVCTPQLDGVQKRGNARSPTRSGILAIDNPSKLQPDIDGPSIGAEPSERAAGHLRARDRPVQRRTIPCIPSLGNGAQHRLFEERARVCERPLCNSRGRLLVTALHGDAKLDFVLRPPRLPFRRIRTFCTCLARPARGHVDRGHTIPGLCGKRGLAERLARQTEIEPGFDKVRIDLDCARGGIERLRVIAGASPHEVGGCRIAQKAGFVSAADERRECIDGPIRSARYEIHLRQRARRRSRRGRERSPFDSVCRLTHAQ